VNPYPLFNSDNPLLSDYSDSLDIFKDKPFWIWEQEEHNRQFTKTVGQCCFNHIIGKPIKNNKEYPIFPFQQTIYNAIEQNQNIWILKSRGIGITTFLIRYLAWRVLSSSELDNRSIFIISGTREQHANFIKEKLQELFVKKFPFLKLESKYTELWLKKTWLKVFPTRNIKDIRGYFEASYIWVDESDHMDPSIQEELFYSIGPYQEKSKAKIILSSTPNRPDGLMQQIEKDDSNKWKKLKLDYTYGLNTIYDFKEISKIKQDPEFKREYECLYLGKIGNLFSPLLVDSITKRYDELKLNEIPIVHEALHCVGIDPGFGSSNTGIVITEHLKNPDVVRVIYAEEFEKANPQDIVDLCYDFHRQYYPNIRFLVDGSNAGFLRQMRVTFGEDPDYDYRDMNPETNEIIGVNFSTEHKQMLSHLYLMVNEGLLAIPDKYEKLIISLRTCQTKDYSLDKEQTSYDDLLDGLRLSLKGYNIK
jgi:hypothetical protein